MLVILIFTVKVEKYVVYIFRKICVQKLRNGSKKKTIISGYIFLNRFGERITTRGIAQQLKHFAEKYGMNKEVVYPHSFRHRFAKNFLDRFNDLALLADLMGHESIETTRIYLRRTASEQQKIVDKVVNW
ncbi:tyrosine-type recombinase/integrase [Bacteroides ovatus]|nr:tyrosine-type recombinase/integrase [Bacteroides ovatus]